MSKFIYGYAWVSTEQQNLDRQVDALTRYGKIHYIEKMTGTRKDRPELKNYWKISRNMDKEFGECEISYFKPFCDGNYINYCT